MMASVPENLGGMVGYWIFGAVLLAVWLAAWLQKRSVAIFGLFAILGLPGILLLRSNRALLSMAGTLCVALSALGIYGLFGKVVVAWAARRS